MEILDHDITALPPKQKLNWLGKAFYFVEVLWMVLGLLVVSGELYFIHEHEVLLILASLFTYYVLFGTIFSLYGNAFASRSEKLFAIIGFWAGLPALVLFLMFLLRENDPPEYFWLLSWPAMILATISFFYFLIRLTNRNTLSYKWNFLAMLVRLGLYLLPVVTIIYVRLVVVGMK